MYVNKRGMEDTLAKWAIAVVLAAVLYLAYQGWAKTEGAAMMVPEHSDRIGKLEVQIKRVEDKVDLLLGVAVRQGEVSKALVEKVEKENPDATPNRGGEPLQR